MGGAACSSRLLHLPVMVGELFLFALESLDERILEYNKGLVASSEEERRRPGKIERYQLRPVLTG